MAVEAEKVAAWDEEEELEEEVKKGKEIRIYFHICLKTNTLGDIVGKNVHSSCALFKHRAFLIKRRDYLCHILQQSAVVLSP